MSVNKDVAKEVMELCKKRGVSPKFKLVFPIYNILPKEVQLAKEVLAKHGMRVELQFENKK